MHRRDHAAGPGRTLAAMKVLHVRAVTGAGGGPDKTIVNSPRYLPAHGHEAWCAFLRPPGDEGFSIIERRGAAAGAEVIAIDDRGPWDLRVIRHLRNCLT